MPGVLIVAEHLQGELRDVTAELVSAGRQLSEQGGGRVVLAVLARDPDALAEAGRLDGVDEVVRVPVAEQEFNAEIVTAALAALIEAREPAVVLAGFTVNGMGFGAALALRAGLGFATDVVGCALERGQVVALRRFYGGKVEAELEFPQRNRVLLLLRPTIWPAAAPGGAAEVTTFDGAAPPPSVRTRHREFVAPPAGDVDITLADVVLAIGRGVGERDNIPRFASLADTLGATLAASRPLIDAGWMPAERQVGQSGKTVKPEVYLAFGVSGAVQHLAGMKASKTIVAVNSDPDAAIFDVADYGAVADVFAVAEELEKLL
ncbi:MAG: electron transfer flavoprotein alpha subunit [Conexibacter sp.]|nr:electron transfer flavoprotein alpha subunit [Conexibacter sp.]